MEAASVLRRFLALPRAVWTRCNWHLFSVFFSSQMWFIIHFHSTENPKVQTWVSSLALVSAHSIPQRSYGAAASIFSLSNASSSSFLSLKLDISSTCTKLHDQTATIPIMHAQLGDNWKSKGTIYWKESMRGSTAWSLKEAQSCNNNFWFFIYQSSVCVFQRQTFSWDF